MPPKRRNPSDTASERPAKKVAKGGSKAAPKTKSKTKVKAPVLQKSAPPNWDKPEYSNEAPTGKWSKKCTERWCLLPPYDTSISEAEWKCYYRERAGLDQVNTIGSRESRMIEAEELCGEDGAWDFLRYASGEVAAAIYGSVLDDERKKQIGRTLLGSLYLTELSGSDDGGGSARDITAMSRLYSPFGLGTSIDLWYSYYVRMRISWSGERIGSLYVRANTIDDCDPKPPRKCRAMVLTPGFIQKEAPGARSVFHRGGSRWSGTTAANIKSFEGPLFGCEGWLSPLKLLNILLAAAGIMYFDEGDTETPESTLAKFQFFQGENNGKDMLKEEFAKLDELEKEASDDEGCVSQRRLLLAREESDAEQSDEEE
ncbi:hypothetical protein FRC07_003905 [Ceratobasidium sp. 392]|nr:hypothetical protein FRC07_003905 [Ceratobasidium sp. 392]